MQRQEEHKETEKKQEKESDVLASFRAVWEKPFTQIIREVCQYDYQALHQFHLRMRKGIECDEQVIENTIQQLEEKQGEELTAEKSTLLHVYEIYQKFDYDLICCEDYRKSLSREILSFCNLIYGDVRLDDKTFYRAYLIASTYDMWGWHTVTEYGYLEDQFAGRLDVHEFNPNALYFS